MNSDGRYKSNAAIVPAGTEPKNQADRARYGRLFHDFATGLHRKHWWLP